MAEPNQPHEHFEQLAVGHVLGGLARRDASRFRAHLAGCRDCRMRVAELRGIAADLAAAEQDERARLPVATDLQDEPEELEEGTEPPAGPMRPAGRPLVVAAIAIVVASAIFFGYHQRRVATEYAGVVGAQEAVLHTLTVGTRLPTEVEEGIEAVAAVDDGRVAVTLAGIPELPSDALLVAWLVDEEVRLERVLADATIVRSGQVLPFSLVVDGAEALIVSVERRLAGVPTEPSARRLLTVRLGADPGADGAPAP